MSLYYRLELTAKGMQPLTYTPESNVVQSIDVNLARGDKYPSNLAVTLFDPRVSGRQWPIFNTLPDPAFSAITARLYLSKAGESQAASKLVFDGEVTSAQPGYPGVSHTTVVAHDRSFSLHRQAGNRTYKNRTSVQIAQQVAADHGITVDTSALTNVILQQRAIAMQAAGIGKGFMSDHAYVGNLLTQDGLSFHFEVTTMKVYPDPTTIYPTVYTPDDERVISFDVAINHVAGPGKSGSVKSPVPGGNKGTQLSGSQVANQETVDETAASSTHRFPTGSGPASSQGAHTENLGSRKGVDARARRRKNTATLTIRTTPDISLQNLIAVTGWGAAIDGNWYIEAIGHSITGGAGTTTISLASPPNKYVQKKAGVVQPGGTST